MNRKKTALMIGLAISFAMACDDDPVSQPTVPDFEGQWILISTVVAKAACLDAQPDDFSIEEVDIRQDGNDVTLTFADYAVAGLIERGVLVAEGELPDAATLRVELARSGDLLEGAAEISSEGCREQRTVLARPRTADANLDGHWGFELTVVGEEGCPHISDYLDCFRIFQTGSDLLVVDDEGGNLAGQVIGDVAQIDRDTATEITSLLFHVDAADRLTGTAIRLFPDLECRTVLSFVGHLRQEPCAGVTP